MSTAPLNLAFLPPGRLTREDYDNIARAYQHGHSPTDIGRAIGRDHCTIVNALKSMGIYHKKRPNFTAKPATQTPQHLARENSPIILVGFSNSARIMKFVRQFGADRIRVVPPTPGKVFGEVHHG